VRPHGNASILDDLEHSRRANPDRLCDLLRPGSSVSAQDCLDYALDAVGWNFVGSPACRGPPRTSTASCAVISTVSWQTWTLGMQAEVVSLARATSTAAVSTKASMRARRCHPR